MQHSPEAQSRSTVAITGATGYVGGRLVPRLLSAGYRVRCLVRSHRKAMSRPWSRHEGVEIVETDLQDTSVLTEQLSGCKAAYFLIHSMQSVGKRYADADRDFAARFAQAAEAAGVERIIYLGGLGEVGENLSQHLSSRREVESVLACTSVPVTVLRAAMIIGSGSGSFEILRYLVERLPVMVTPKWVATESQPIAIGNVLHYLVECLHHSATVGKTLDIGGPEVISYRKLMEVMAEALRLRKRLILPVPVLTPKLSSGWIHLVTPVSYRLARPLAEGLRNRVVCRDDLAQRLMPQRLLSIRQAIDAALGQTLACEVETTWSDAGAMPGDPDWAGGTTFVDKRQIEIQSDSAQVFDAVCRVGGGNGYYAADWLWRLRGFMDRMVGGPGLRRGRRHPRELAVGDALDFWRVVEVQKPTRLSLIAEMKLPGVARMDLLIEEDGQPGAAKRTRLVQHARFKPKGLLGLMYWYTVLPLHHIVFGAMLRGIRNYAENQRTSVGALTPSIG